MKQHQVFMVLTLIMVCFSSVSAFFIGRGVGYDSGEKAGENAVRREALANHAAYIVSSDDDPNERSFVFKWEPISKWKR